MPTAHPVGKPTRREFMRLGMLGLGGVNLAQVLEARAKGATGRSNRSVILFWMWGGPSQLETYDPKPDAPADIRGPFRPIKTAVPGMDVCELFPLQARVADKFSLIRSLHHTMSAHNDGSIEVLTGKTPIKPDPSSTALSDHPDFGMVASRLRGARPDGMPNYVGIPRRPFMIRPNYVGVSHDAFPTGDPSAANFKPQGLTVAAGVDGTRLGDRRGLMRQFDGFRRVLAASDEPVGHPFREQAIQLLTNPSVERAFDLSREDPRLRDRYGRHLWGQSCLLARRLAEAGVGVITIDALAPGLSERYFSWDDHINVQTKWDLGEAMKYRAPFMDQAVSALIEDVFARGMDRDVLILALGEFGRTPRIVRNSGIIGRDHWPSAQSALISGGGLRMGQVVGATNRYAEYPVERPLKPQDLLATVYRHLGIDPGFVFHDPVGRPIPILNEGEPIAELV